jgi:Pyruvate kinase
MLAKIAAFTETHRPRTTLMGLRELLQQQAAMTGGDGMVSVVEHALDTVPCDLVLVPTRSGTTARILSRCKPPVWLVAPSLDSAVCQGLAFSYGVHPVETPRRTAIGETSSNDGYGDSLTACACCLSPDLRTGIQTQITASS